MFLILSFFFNNIYKPIVQSIIKINSILINDLLTVFNNLIDIRDSLRKLNKLKCELQSNSDQSEFTKYINSPNQSISTCNNSLTIFAQRTHYTGAGGRAGAIKRRGGVCKLKRRFCKTKLGFNYKCTGFMHFSVLL